MKCVFLGVAFVVIAALHIGIGCAGLPGFEGDAAVYMPYAVNYAMKRGLVNPFFVEHLRFDSSGKARLYHHGFLFQQIAGTLLPNFYCLHLLFAVINVLTIGLTAILMLLVGAHKQSSVTWESIALTGMSMGSLSTYANGLVGRPEPFVMLVAIMAVGAWLLIDSRWAFAILGVALGIIAAANPGCGVVGAAVMVQPELEDRNVRVSG